MAIVAILFCFFMTSATATALGLLFSSWPIGLLSFVGSWVMLILVVQVSSKKVGT